MHAFEGPFRSARWALGVRASDGKLDSALVNGGVGSIEWEDGPRSEHAINTDRGGDVDALEGDGPMRDGPAKIPCLLITVRRGKIYRDRIMSMHQVV